MDNLPSSEDAPFQTLIAAKDSLFRYHFSPPPEALNFTHNLGNLQPRLANKKEPFGRPHGLARISLNFWGNHGQSVIV